MSDAALIQQVLDESADHLRPWLTWMADEPLTLEQRQTLLAEQEGAWLAGGDVLLAVLVNDAVAGGCEMHRLGDMQTLEIGYWIHPSFLHRGIATTVADLLTNAGFLVAGIEQVEIRHDKANIASAVIAQRLGYEFVGETPGQPSAPAESGTQCAWRIARHDWLTRRPTG